MTAKSDESSHSTQVAPRPGASRFVDLPPELRYQVYKSVLEDGRIDFFNGYYQFTDSLRDIYSLMETCHKTRTECAHILVDKKRVHFYIAPSDDHLVPSGLDSSHQLNDTQGNGTDAEYSIVNDVTFSPSSFLRVSAFVEDLAPRDYDYLQQVPFKFSTRICPDRLFRPIGFGTSLLRAYPDLRNFEVLFKLRLPPEIRSACTSRSGTHEGRNWPLKLAKTCAETIVADLSQSTEDGFGWCAASNGSFERQPGDPAERTRSGVHGKIRCRRASKKLAEHIGIKVDLYDDLYLTG